MKKFAPVASLALLFPLLTVAASRSDDAAPAAVPGDRTVAQAAPAEPGARPGTPARPARREARGRLPNYYRQAGVTDAQREQIYAIQAKYQEQIEAIEQQLREVVEKRDKEVQAVLTPEQLATVKRLEEEAAQRRASAGGERYGASGNNLPAPARP